MNRIEFLNGTYLPWVIAFSLLLLVFFIWKEWEGTFSKRFWLHALLSLIGIFALAGIVLKPANLNAVTAQKVAVLTPHFIQKQVDSLKTRYKDLKVLKYTKGMPLVFPKISGDSIFILGEGLHKLDLDQLKNNSTVLLGKDSIFGITALKFPDKIKLGEDFVFQGNYQFPKNGQWLYLEDDNGKKLDSTQFGKANNVVFKLKTRPKIEGLHTFYLVEKGMADTQISKNTLPFEVEKATTLKIWMLTSFPTFEIKYLKNFLAEKGHELVVQTQLTRGRFKYEFFNTDQRAIPKLKSENLEVYDLIILDNETLTGMSTQVFERLQKGVKSNGLGLFILPNDQLFRNGDRFKKFNFLSTNSLKVKMADYGMAQVDSYPFTFENKTFTQTILENQTGEIVAATQVLGKGKLATTSLKHTYELILNGREALYKKLWVKIINAASKPNLRKVQWRQENVLIYPQHPFRFSLETNLEQPKVILNNDYEIPLINSANLPFAWSGTLFPRTAGWHKLAIQDLGEVFSFYIFNATKWKEVQSHNNWQHTKQWIAAQSQEKVNPVKLLEPLNLWLFYVLAIGSFGYLWLAPKLG